MSATATLFDFNGVLVDDEHVHLEAFREALAEHGVTLTDAQYTEHYMGFDDVGAFTAILRDRGLDASEEVVSALVRAKVPLYMRRIGAELRIFPGAVELVRRRAARGTVGVVSGALRHEIEHCLEAMGVRELVAFIVSAEDTRACKPDPEGYVIGRSKLPAGSVAVALEDSLAGVRAARTAGLRCVAVTHSYPRAQLVEAGADLVVDSLAALDDETFEGASS